MPTLSTPAGAGTGGVTVETQTASSTPLNRANRWEVRPQLNDNSDQHDGSTDVRRGEDGGASCWDIYVLNIALTRSYFVFGFRRNKRQNFICLV